MMRVLHLINDLSAGGAQSELFYLIKNSVNIEDFTHEVCVIHEAGEFGNELQNLGVHIHEFNFHKRFSPVIAFRLFNLIKREDYQIIHVHLFPGLYWGACLTWMFPNSRWVYTEHNMWNKRRELPWARGLESWVYRQYNQIIAISENTAQSLLDWQPGLKEKLVILPNGIDISRFNISGEQASIKRAELGVSEKTALILFVGRLVEQKGVDILLKAVALLDTPEWQLWVVGDGSEMASLKKLCGALDLNNRVHFLGTREDIPELMAASDLVVLPSRWEGLPITLLEAMAAGKAVVASQVGGVPEVLRDCKEGLLVPSDNPVAMKAAIQKILLDPGLANSLGNAGKQRAELYSVETTAIQLHSLYERLL